MKTYTTLQAIGDMIVIYFIVIVISMLVAAVIRGIVVVLSRQADQETPKDPINVPSPPITSAPKPISVASIPQEHLAAITAAVATIMGAHRIIRILTPERGHGWTSEARTVHHTSHAPRGTR